jgi:hypothetical protein
VINNLEHLPVVVELGNDKIVKSLVIRGSPRAADTEPHDHASITSLSVMAVGTKQDLHACGDVE